MLLDLVRRVYPNVPALFINTGLEYPEIQHFVRNTPETTIVRPKMIFNKVVETYGYPLISKEVSDAIYYARKTTGKSPANKRAELMGTRDDTARLSVRRKMLLGDYSYNQMGKGEVKSAFNKEKWLPLCQLPIPISAYCCTVMKKLPGKHYSHTTHSVPYLGILTEESRLRTQQWVRRGCNAYDSQKPTSQPLSFWTEQDILAYIKTRNLPIADVYGDIVETDKGFDTTGAKRTGCVFCAYGLHLEKGETRFQRLAKTHPRQYEYCMGGGQWIDNPNYDPDMPEYTGTWKNWNPIQIWVPSKEGLGMKTVFDMVNEIYGKDFYRYEPID